MTQFVIQHYAAPRGRFRLWVGTVIVLGALLFAFEQGAAWLAAHPMATRGLQASLLAGLATGLGAIPVLFLRRPQPSLMAPMLGLAGGMMLAASFFSLLVPATGIVAASAAPLPLAVLTAGALLAGGALMQAMDRRFSHVHVESLEDGNAKPRLALVVVAIALHNVPEGLAVGVAAAAGADHGMTMGIALQNIPEGWIVASALLALRMPALRAAAIALATGLVEPLGGLLGVVATSLAGAALPLALAGAAGAMLWVVGHELIPASLKPGRISAGNVGMAGGFAVMTALAALI